MGYVRKNPEITVTAPEFPGLEIKATSMSVQEWIDFTGMGTDGTVTTGNLQDSTRIFARHVVSWNLENAPGVPVVLPDDPEQRAAAVLGESLDMVLAMSTSWLQLVSGVSAPLEQTSSAGALSQAVPLPMEALEESPAPSGVQS